MWVAPRTDTVFEKGSLTFLACYFSFHIDEVLLLSPLELATAIVRC